MDTVTALYQMHDTFSDHHHWTKGVHARNNQGVSVGPIDPGATRWCAVGLADKMQFEHPELDDRVFSALHRACFRLFFNSSIATVNDDHGRKAILQAIESAIEFEEAGT